MSETCSIVETTQCSAAVYTQLGIDVHSYNNYLSS